MGLQVFWSVPCFVSATSSTTQFLPCSFSAPRDQVPAFGLRTAGLHPSAFVGRMRAKSEEVIQRKERKLVLLLAPEALKSFHLSFIFPAVKFHPYPSGKVKSENYCVLDRFSGLSWSNF